MCEKQHAGGKRRNQWSSGSQGLTTVYPEQVDGRLKGIESEDQGDEGDDMSVLWSQHGG